MHNTKWYIGGGVILIICMIAFGISVSVMFEDSKKMTPDNVECGKFPNVTSYTLEKQNWDRWHWRYNIQEFSGYARLKCPTTQYDTEFFVDDKFAGYIDGKILSLTSRANINDCHGNLLHVIQTGSIFQTFINGNKIWVTFIMEDTAGNTLAYVEGTHFFDDTIRITDLKGNGVAILEKRFLKLPYTWHITILQADHPAGNPLVLGMIAAKYSFSDSYSYSLKTDRNGNKKITKTKRSDMCNDYFWSVSFILIGLLCVIIFFAIAFICSVCYDFYESRM